MPFNFKGHNFEPDIMGMNNLIEKEPQATPAIMTSYFGAFGHQT